MTKTKESYIKDIQKWCMKDYGFEVPLIIADALFTAGKIFEEKKEKKKMNLIDDYSFGVYVTLGLCLIFSIFKKPSWAYFLGFGLSYFLVNLISQLIRGDLK
jgi:hypothetical protein